MRVAARPVRFSQLSVVCRMGQNMEVSSTSSEHGGMAPWGVQASSLVGGRTPAAVLATVAAARAFSPRRTMP